MTLVDPSAGGSWSSSAPATATVDSSSGIVTGIAAGGTTISYSTGCGLAATFLVSVNPTPDAGVITGPSIVYTGSVVTLADTATGGIWLSSDPAIAAIGSLSGSVTGVARGVASITYSVTRCGVNAYALFSITDSEMISAVRNSSSAVPSVLIYPNPVSDRLYIQWNNENGETGCVRLFDMAGQEVYTINIRMTAGSGGQQLDLPELANGSYLIVIKTDKINYVNKVQVLSR